METLSKKWVLILINALLIICFGLILIFIPIQAFKSLVFAIGALIAFVGLILIFGAFNYAKESKSMVFWLFQGLFNLVIGAVVLFFPEASIKFLLILAGLWAIVLGVYQFSVGLIPDTEIKGKLWHKINGAAAVLIGILLIFTPGLIIGFVVYLFAFLLVGIGGGLLYFAFLLKRLGELKNLDEEAGETTEVDPDLSENDEIIP